jgi:hypothetical protein
MKRIFSALLAFGLGSAATFAAPIFLGSVQLSPDNPATEEAYLENTILQGLVDVTLFANHENLNGSSFSLDELCPAPLATIVVLKWGGQGGGTQQYWGILPGETLPVVFTQPAGLGGLSHVRVWCTTLIPGTYSVPDSGATLGLMGLGFGALALIRRKLS